MAIILELLAHHKRVLLTAPSNVAVDYALVSLLACDDEMRRERIERGTAMTTTTTTTTTTTSVRAVRLGHMARTLDSLAARVGNH